MNPHSWEAVMPLLDAMGDAVRVPKEPIFPEVVELKDAWFEAIADCEPAERATVTAAALQIANGEPLPALTPVQLALLALRIHSARGLMWALQATEEAAAPTMSPIFGYLMTAPDKVRWLVTEGWEIQGSHQWQETCYWSEDWRIFPPLE